METRGGFTIVELLVALVLLTVGVLGLQMVTGRMLRTVSTLDRRAIAAQIAEDRIEQVRADPSYGSLTVRYGEEAAPLPEYPGLTRETLVVRQRDSTETGVTDFTRITVVVEGAGLSSPVTRSVSVGRP
ncbi:MAG TPA: prepilin-type N-terminal cleavage/methylation domain-containing protein [Longimicrobiales bacterium]